MKPETIVLALRSTLFNLLAVVITLLYSLLFPLLSLGGNGPRFRTTRAYAGLLVWLLRVICGISYRINYHDRSLLDGGEPLLFVANHQSAYETLMLQVVLPPHSWVVKQELMRVPAVGGGLRMLRAVAIDRSKGIEAINKVVKEGKALLDSGLSLLIFPEGTRTKSDTIAPLFPGAVLLARRAERQLVPVVHNAGRCWPRNSFLKYPGVVEVTVGGAMVLPAQSKRANQMLHQWMVDAYGQLGQGRAPAQDGGGHSPD